MDKAVVGIDVAKNSLDVVLLTGDQSRHASFKNTPEGHVELLQWVSQYHRGGVHACLEATGQYGEAVAEYLHQHGQVVSVVNPTRIKGYAESKLRRNKTDKQDAALIADFCASQNPPAWHPLPANVKTLQALMRRREDLLGMLQQEKNRQKSGQSASQVQASLQSVVEFLEKSIREIDQQIHDLSNQDPELKHKRDLLTSIPGIGNKTAFLLLSEVPHLSDFARVNELVAFGGLNPRSHRSGSSINGRPRLSKKGSSRLRKGLYFPAIVAQKHNPILKVFADRLLRAGKPKLCVIGAVMRKLLHLVYGILKSGRPFDPDYLHRSPTTP